MKKLIIALLSAALVFAAFAGGYKYAVHTARLTDDYGGTYIITYGIDDGNEYSR